MIKLEKSEVMGWEHAVRGMRNPMNSWDRSDSGHYLRVDDHISHPKPAEGSIMVAEIDDYEYRLGPADQKLMTQLRNAGTDHRKFMRMITVYVDITAPLYWWKEFDTYKVGTVANSCSTMHKIAEKEFMREDFSHDRLIDIWDFEPDIRDMAPVIEADVASDVLCNYLYGPDDILDLTINMLNKLRTLYIRTKDKSYWYTMIQLLPTSYNQKRTVMMNYEVLANIYKSRKNHRLDEWRDFCTWIEGLPFDELITGETEM